MTPNLKSRFAWQIVRNPKSLAGLLVLIFSACSAGTSTPRVRVLAAETFLADMAQNVAGDHLQVESLLPPGVDPHEFQPAPQDAIKIAQSRVLIVNGLNYETWLQKSLQDAGNAPTLITATQGLASAPGGDPHLWMDPANAIRYVENIRDGLTQADPTGKEVYAAHAAAYIAQLKELDASIRSLVAQVPPERRLLVTNHDDLGPFAQAYGFQIVGAVIPSVTDEASPSAQQMAALIDTIKQAHAPAVFVDVGANRNLADQVASGTGAKVVTGLYIESLSPPDGPAPTYIEMMKYDAGLIVDALK
jgi:ABC-type Zn uptake system ZnuABC Zn-binding protein ZnuA